MHSVCFFNSFNSVTQATSPLLFLVQAAPVIILVELGCTNACWFRSSPRRHILWFFCALVFSCAWRSITFTKHDLAFVYTTLHVQRAYRAARIVRLLLLPPLNVWMRNLQVTLFGSSLFVVLAFFPGYTLLPQFFWLFLLLICGTLVVCYCCYCPNLLSFCLLW